MAHRVTNQQILNRAIKDHYADCPPTKTIMEEVAERAAIPYDEIPYVPVIEPNREFEIEVLRLEHIQMKNSRG